MTETNKYDMSLNLLNHARKALSNADYNLELLQECTVFNQALNDVEHIISPTELVNILDRFAAQHPEWRICIETERGTVDEKFSSHHLFYEGMGDMIVLDFE